MDKKIYKTTKENTALLVIDMQDALLNALKGKGKLIRRSKLIMQAVNIMELPIITTEQYPKGLGSTSKKLIDLCYADKIYSKNAFTAYISEVKAELENLDIKNVLVIGAEAHICVWQTVRDLLADNYEVTVLSDAVSSRHGFDKKTALRSIEAMGAHVSTCESVIYDMLETAKAPEFKEISAFVKEASLTKKERKIQKKEAKAKKKAAKKNARK